MNEKLRNHVNILFVAAPKTAKAEEIKEELFTNLDDKYNDLLAQGYDSTAAFHIALSGIGNLEELFEACGGAEQPAAKPAISSAGSAVPTAPLILITPKASWTPLFLMLAVGMLPAAFVVAQFGQFVIGLHVSGFIALLFLVASGILFICAIASWLSKGSRLAEEYYQQHIFSQGEQHGFTREFVQREIQALVRQNKLLGTALVVMITFLSFFLIVVGVVATAPTEIKERWQKVGMCFGNRIIPTGQIITQEREIDNFTVLKVSGAITVDFKQSDKNLVVIETHEDIMPLISTIVQNSSLTIHQNANRFRNVKKLRVTVYGQNVPQSFSATGASRLSCEEPLPTTRRVVLRGDGASKLHFTRIDSPDLDIVLKGASKMDIAGKSESVHIQANGASKLWASDLETERCDAEVTGASNVEFGKIGKELSVRASGASKFSYSGTPMIKKQDISGASKVNAR